VSKTGFSHAHPAGPVPGCTVPVGRLEELARRPGRTVAVLVADIDELDAIRGTHGQPVCDMLMKAVAGRLNRLLRPGDRLARLDGHRYVLLVEDDNELGPVEALTARVDAASNGTFGIAGIRFEVASTVGVAFAGRGEDVPADLLRGADVARAGKRAEPDTIDLRAITRPGRSASRPVFGPTVLDPIV
jgi:diguanylate cyclase (GGDEF)-like protein